MAGKEIKNYECSVRHNSQTITEYHTTLEWRFLPSSEQSLRSEKRWHSLRLWVTSRLPSVYLTSQLMLILTQLTTTTATSNVTWHRLSRVQRSTRYCDLFIFTLIVKLLCLLPVVSSHLCPIKEILWLLPMWSGGYCPLRNVITYEIKW